MQHHKDPEPDQGKKNWYAEEDPLCELQCADSLAIAANRIGEGGRFRIEASALAVAYCLRICSRPTRGTASASGGA